MEKRSEVNIKIKHKIEFIAFKVAITVLKKIPYKISENFLIFLSRIIKIRKETAKKNLIKVFPNKSEEEISKIITEVYKNYAKNTAELYLGNKERLFEDVKTEGWENLEEALSLNKGVILASGHLGNWELAGAYIAKKHKISVVIKKQRNPLFNKYMVQMRENDNIKIIYKKNALREIIKDLKKNYIVTILIDQNAGKSGILTDFLSFPASTYVGAAKIALKTGSPIVPAFAVRDRNGKNVFYFEKYIDPLKYDNNNDSVKKITDILNRRLEKYILKYPEQWFWVHKRWKGAKKAKILE